MDEHCVELWFIFVILTVFLLEFCDVQLKNHMKIGWRIKRMFVVEEKCVVVANLLVNLSIN